MNKKNRNRLINREQTNGCQRGGKVEGLGEKDEVQIGNNKIVTGALAGVAQWIEPWPVKRKIANSVLHRGTCLGCSPGP